MPPPPSLPGCCGRKSCANCMKCKHSAPSSSPPAAANMALTSSRPMLVWPTAWKIARTSSGSSVPLPSVSIRANVSLAIASVCFGMWTGRLHPRLPSHSKQSTGRNEEPCDIHEACRGNSGIHALERRIERTREAGEVEMKATDAERHPAVHL